MFHAIRARLARLMMWLTLVVTFGRVRMGPAGDQADGTLANDSRAAVTAAATDDRTRRPSS